MSSIGNDAPSTAPTRRWWREPAWWFPLAVFFATRALNALEIAWASRQQIALDPSTFQGMYIHSVKVADPGYLSVITNWDGQWYESVAVDGYRLPATDEGASSSTGWAWAFPPLFPLTVRAVMWATHLPFPWAVTVLNVLVAAVAMLLLYRVLDRSGGRFLAMSGVALTTCFISAPLLQTAYSEALGLALLAGIFLSLMSERYLITLVLVVALAYTRLITPPIAIVALSLLLSLRHARGSASLIKAVWLTLIAGASILGVWLWSGLVAILVPVPTGATARTNIARDMPLGWFADAYTYLGWPGVAVVLLLAATLALAAFSRWTRDWHIVLRTWLWAYPAFILAATPITGGIFRYLLLCPPLALLPAGSRGVIPPWVRTSLVAAACLVGLCLQAMWISGSLVIGESYLMP